MTQVNAFPIPRDRKILRELDELAERQRFVHHVADFLANVAKKHPTSPTFREALETQKICDAVLASAKSGAWTNVG